MSNVKLLSTLPCLLLILLSVLSDVSHAALSDPPLNHAASVGETVVLQCRVVEPPPVSRIMWGEFITNSGGSVISDNTFVLTDHPNSDRYRIINVSPNQFDLEIRDVRFSDGGRYVCQDSLSGPPDVFRGEAELIVLDTAPNCTTTQPDNGNVVEGQTHTVECIIHYQGQYAPTMTWSGPPPFTVGQSPPNPTSVWSGVEYVVDRSMDTRAFQCLTNFTDIGSVAPDAASNIPTWSHLYRAGQIFVFWGPTDLYVEPIKEEYSVGDQITCFADAFPVASYNWQNMRTLDIFVSQTYTITQDLVGFNQSMRCQAQNDINGFIYSRNLFTPVYVPGPTSPPTTSTTVPTTTLPAEGPCKDLSGSWIARDPYAEMILEVNHQSEIGEIKGIMKNLTDTVWVEVVGTVRHGDFLYLGLTAIWPFNDGITGMAGECHACHGTEVIMTDSLWRSVAASANCGQGSTSAPDVAYRFNRVGSSSVLREKEFDVIHPTKEVSGSLGIRLKRRR